MRFLTDLAGTMLSFFRVGTVRLADQSGVLAVRDRGDTVYAGLACSSLNLNPSFGVANVGRIPQWVKFTMPASSFSLSAATSTQTLFSLPAAGFIHAVTTKHSVAFSGGTAASYTVGVGIVSNHTKYAPAFDVFQVATNTAYQDSNVTSSENFGAAVNIVATATVTGDTLDHVSAGSVDIWVLCSVRA